MPDREGKPGDIVLGFDDPADYPGKGSIGAFVGRYANRIAGGSFQLNGRTYSITRNEGKNTLHGGLGYHLRRWNLEPTEKGAALTIFDPDGEEGFPGNVHVRVDVALTESDELILDYTAETDADTVINLTNHSYFNLSGKDQMLDQELYLNADSYLEVDEGLIPTGRRIDVTGTDFDFRTRRPIASGKYDHCFVLNQNGVQAEVWDPSSGRGMRMYTDQPAVQLYCGGGLGGTRGKEGRVYQPFAGFCLETQHFPDSPNQAGFPSTILRAGEVFKSRTTFSFYVE
jgi:aldose 1-epimerase